MEEAVEVWKLRREGGPERSANDVEQGKSFVKQNLYS